MLQAPESAGLRLRGLLGLAAAVLAAHLWLADRALPDALGQGAGDPRLARIEVAFVRELAPAQPVAVGARPVPPARRSASAVALPASASASAAAPAQSTPAARLPGPVVTSQAEPLPATAIATASASASAPPPLATADTPPLASAASAAPAAPSEPTPAGLAQAPLTGAVGAAATAPAGATAFDWPPSTRLSYRLSGHFRGPVEGQARVEWLRSGARYQVHMDVSVGPSFAPLLSRRVSSEGDITDQGLYPRRFEETTRALLRDARRVSIALGETTVRLASGVELPRPADVQDSASQFVQLTWLFTTQPQRLQPGQAIDMPLALPRQLQVWTYDVLASELLDTPAGALRAVHVKPRREARAGGELTAELWFAPSLQYLPVRILIRQDAENFIDLVIERLPQQAEGPR